MFHQYLNIVHTMHNKARQKRVVKRFFIGLNLTLYFSFFGLRLPDPHRGSAPAPAGLGDFPLTLVLKKLQF